MLEVNGLAFSYSEDKSILKDVSLSLEEHDILCLLGPNGTGKTTLLRCLLRLSKFKKGKVSVLGEDIMNLSSKERAKAMAYVPQAVTMSFPYEVIEVVLMGRVAHLSRGRRPSSEDKEIALNALESLGITHLKNKFFNEISGGERQMVLVARAIAQRAKILIMDEPTANLDFGNQVRMLKVIKSLSEKGYGVLMTSHFPDHAFLACNKVALLKGGTVIAKGVPEEIVTSESLSSLYETPICVTSAEINENKDKIKVCIPIME